MACFTVRPPLWESLPQRMQVKAELRSWAFLDGCELYSRGFEDIVAHIHDRLNGRQVYLCFDMDFFDPSCARVYALLHGAAPAPARDYPCCKDWQV